MEVDNHCPDGYWDPRALWPEFDPLGHFNPVEDMQAVFDLACIKLYSLNASPADYPSFRFDIYKIERPDSIDSIETPSTILAGVTVIEIGTWMGQVARMLAEHGAKVFCVDDWSGNDDHLGDYAVCLGIDAVYSRFCENVQSHLLERIFPLCFDSEAAAQHWPHPAQVDMVFIDANHDYKEVLADIRRWEPMVRPGGIICGHDYRATIKDVDTGEQKRCGVRQAVDEIGLDGVLGKSVWWRRIK